MNKARKYLAWTILIIIFLSIGYYMFATAVFSGTFDRDYSAAEAIQNFKERENEILEIAEFFRRHKPAHNEVSLSMHKQKFDISIGQPGWAVIEKFPNRHGSGLTSGTSEANTLLSQVGWTDSIITRLTEKLQATNCLGISSNEDIINIHYRTGTWSSYSYIVFEKPISDSLKKVYNEAQITMLTHNVKLAISHAL